MMLPYVLKVASLLYKATKKATNNDEVGTGQRPVCMTLADV